MVKTRSILGELGLSWKTIGYKESSIMMDHDSGGSGKVDGASRGQCHFSKLGALRCFSHKMNKRW
jgi:hypothetical protein